MTFMERASLRSECRKLTRFLRLTDFMVIDMLRDLAFDSVQTALDRVKPNKKLPRIIMTKTDEELAAESKGKDQDQGSSTEKAYKPLFKVIVSNQADGTLEVGPSAKAFKEGFQEVVSVPVK